MKEQDYHKVDYSSGKNGLTGKANGLLMRTKGRKVMTNRVAVLECKEYPKYAYHKMWL